MDLKEGWKNDRKYSFTNDRKYSFILYWNDQIWKKRSMFNIVLIFYCSVVNCHILGVVKQLDLSPYLSIG